MVSTEILVADPPLRRGDWLLGILSIFWGVLVLPTLWGALLMTAFASDAPGAEQSFNVVFFQLVFALVPVSLLISCIGGLVCSFGAQTSRKVRVGRFFGTLPIWYFGVLLLGMLAIMVFGTVVRLFGIVPLD